MIKKYNIAFTPISNSDRIIQLANNLSHMADKYLLGDHSLPHVTLYQFMLEDREIDAVWEKIITMFDEKNINLTFDEFSCITFDNNIYWTSLMPNNRDVLNTMHSLIASIINMPVKNIYDPHMTLISTKNKEYEKEVKKLIDHYIPVVDVFTISIGECDENGQFTKMLHSYEIDRKIQYKN